MMMSSMPLKSLVSFGIMPPEALDALIMQFNG